MTAETTAGPGSQPLAPSEIDIEHHLPGGWGEGFAGRALYWIAVAFSAFQIYTAIFAPLATQILRAVHVGFLILVATALIANHRAPSQLLKLAAWAVGLAGFGIEIAATEPLDG